MNFRNILKFPYFRSEEQLHKAPAPPVMVEYLRPVGILTSNSPPPTLSRPTSALGQSRDNSQEGHVTKIKIQDNEKEADSKSLRGNYITLTQIILVSKGIVISYLNHLTKIQWIFLSNFLSRNENCLATVTFYFLTNQNKP